MPIATFLGNAPTYDTLPYPPFVWSGTELVIGYYEGATGWGETWADLPTVNLGPAPIITTTTTTTSWTSPDGRVWKSRREQTRMYLLGYI